MVLAQCQKNGFHSISWERMMNLDRIWHINRYWQGLAWDCYIAFCVNFQQRYDPCSTSKNGFRSISWELTDGFQLNLGYKLISTRSSLGLWIDIEKVKLMILTHNFALIFPVNLWLKFYDVLLWRGIMQCLRSFYSVCNVISNSHIY